MTATTGENRFVVDVVVSSSLEEEETEASERTWSLCVGSSDRPEVLSDGAAVDLRKHDVDEDEIESCEDLSQLSCQDKDIRGGRRTTGSGNRDGIRAAGDEGDLHAHLGQHVPGNLCADPDDQEAHMAVSGRIVYARIEETYGLSSASRT